MPWYALYTRPRHEKKVYEQLTEKGIVAFLPMIKSLRQWKDRRKWVEMPLFNSYVFVSIDLKNKLSALQTHGVVKLVDFGGVPAAIPDWQIEQLKRLIDNTDTLMPEQYLKVGDYVEVKSGPLAGIKGYLREIRGEWRVAILVEGIFQSTSFVVDRANVQKISVTEDN
jgi:transcription elongation factor/antiterminator RfaH